MNKNNKGKVNYKTMIILLAIVGIAALFLVTSTGKIKTVLEHAEPADISEEESGTGLKLRLFDDDGNPIEIPEWFSAGYGSEFSIIKRPSPPPCVDRTGCVGHLTNPKIMCWKSDCVIGGVGAIALDFGVTNPPESQLSFLNLGVSSASPPAFNTAVNKDIESELVIGETRSFIMASTMGTSQFEGTTQTFSVTVEGTNQYTGQVVQVSDSLQLAFAADPTGSFNVNLVSPI